MDFINGLIPVGTIGEFPQVLVVNSQVPTKTLREFIDLAKANPGKLAFGSAGIGSTSYLAVRKFAFKAHINLVHVPYRGMAPALSDLLAGRVQMLGVGLLLVDSHLASGKLRVLAVGSRNRLPQLPDVPTGEQSGLSGYELSTWLGIVAPKGTPKEIVAQLNAYLSSIASDPVVQKRLASVFINPMKTTPEELKETIEHEKVTWEKFKSSGMELK